MRASGWKANSAGGQEKFPEEVTFGKYMHIRRGRGSKLWVEKAAGGKARGLPRQIRTNMQGVAERRDNNAEEAERFYEDLQDLLELTPPKDVLFIIGD